MVCLLVGVATLELCITGATVTLSGLLNSTSYTGNAQFFVQVQGDGIRLSESNVTRDADGHETMVRRESDRTLVTHDGWPVRSNTNFQSSEPGLHTLALEVVSFRGRHLEPERLFSKRVFSSSSQPYCDAASNAEASSCAPDAFVPQIPFRATSSQLDMQIASSTVSYAILDPQRGETEWALRPFLLQDRQHVAVLDNSDIGLRVRARTSTFHQLKAPAAVPYAVIATKKVPTIDWDPVIRIPLSIMHVWRESQEFVREDSAVVVTAKPFFGGTCGEIGMGMAPTRSLITANTSSHVIPLRRGAGQGVVVLQASELFDPPWAWWKQSTVAIGSVDACVVTIDLSVTARCPFTYRGKKKQCTSVSYPGQSTVRLVPFPSNDELVNSDGLHTGSVPRWQHLLTQVTVAASERSKQGSVARAHSFLYAFEDVYIREGATLEIGPESLVVLGPEVDLHVQLGGVVRVGLGAVEKNRSHAAMQQSESHGVQYHVSTTLICGAPPSIGDTLMAEARRDLEWAWGGIAVMGWDSIVELEAVQIIDAGQGWAPHWTLVDSSEDSGPAHLQEKAVLDIRYGAELEAHHVVLHGRRGQALVGMAATIELSLCHIHGFAGGLQLANTVVHVFRCHLSHFFNHPSPVWAHSPHPKTPKTPGSRAAELPPDLELELKLDGEECLASTIHPFANMDNDAIYIVGGDTVLRSSVIVGAGDDCVDSGTGPGGTVEISGCWVESCQHEGLGLSNNGAEPKSVRVVHTVVRGCQQGLELGFSTPLLSVEVHHTVFAGNHVGLRLGDNYGWNTFGSVACVACVFAENGRDVLSLHRNGFAQVPLQQLILASCLLQSRDMLPLVVQLEQLHGHSKDCARFLGSDVLPYNHHLQGAFSPECRNAFLAGPPRIVHSNVVRTLGYGTDNGSGNGSSGVTAGSFPKNVPAWMLDGLLHGINTKGVNHQNTTIGGRRDLDVPSATVEGIETVDLLQAPRFQVVHGQSQQLEAWDVAKRIRAHDRLEAASERRSSTASLDPDSLTRREGAPATIDGDDARTESGEADAIDTDLNGVGRALQDLKWAVSDVHMLILWSSTPEVVAQEVVQYLCSSASGVDVLGAWSVLPSGSAHSHTKTGPAMSRSLRSLHLLSEDFFRSFYGASYYNIYETLGDGSQQVGMAEHKGRGPFIVLLLEDPTPEFGIVPGHPEKGLRVNKRIYSLKHHLRQWMARRFQLHSTQNETEAEREIKWMFGGTRREVAAQLHRELRALHHHHDSELHATSTFQFGRRALFNQDSMGLQSPICWPPSRPHLKQTRPSDASMSWNGWTGGWIGGSWGGSLLSNVALLPAVQRDELHHTRGAPHFRVLRRVPMGDVIAVILKGEWPKMQLDVASIERDLHNVILEPDPYNMSQNFQRAVLLGKISLPLTLHTPMDTEWFLTFIPAQELAQFRILAAKAWPTSSQCATVAATWDSVKPFMKRPQELENLQLRKIVEMVQALQAGGPRILDWTVVALTHSTDPSFAGPYTLWDGNHRAVALFGYQKLREEDIAASRFRYAHDRLEGGPTGDETLLDVHVRLYVGQSKTVQTGHKGTFYCRE